MRIEYIKVKNFGIHEQKELHFNDGFIVVRGSNGAGKSTLVIQATLYAMFGSSTLDASIADTVLEGKSETSMKVELRYGTYTVVRSKSSASVISDDESVKISGQAEVSDFFYDLFGIHKRTESLVLISKQGDTAGVLNKKPTEVNTLIETLAGFEEIDELIERVKDKYPSGLNKAYESTLSNLEERLEEVKSEEVEDPYPVQVEIGWRNDDLHKLNEDLKVEKNSKKAREGVLQEARENNKKIQDMEKDKKHYKESVGEYQDSRQDWKDRFQVYLDKVESYEPVSEAVIARHTQEIEEFESNKKIWECQEWVDSLRIPEDLWEGDEGSFNTELSEVSESVRRLTKEVTEDEHEIKTLERNLKTRKTECLECGSDLSERVDKINSSDKDKIQDISSQLHSKREELESESLYLEVLNEVNTLHLARKKSARPYEKQDLLEIDYETIPHGYKLAVPEVEEPSVERLKESSRILSEAKAEEKTHKDDIKQRDEASRMVASLAEKIEKAELKLEKVNQDLEGMDTVDPTPLKEKIEETEGRIGEIENSVREYEKSIKDLELKLAVLKEKGENRIKEINRIKEEIKDNNRLLKEDIRNSKILKSVKDAKPKVLKAVWDKILITVSQTYSNMVGDQMSVTKDDKGFRINGLPVARLSGSEKSSLGIALRATLRDVFAPTAGFVFFDEPFADMDMERTARVSASILSVPGQKFVITHEDNSEVAADQFIDID